MKKQSKSLLLENLAAAGVMAFGALIVSTAALLSDSHMMKSEMAALSSLAGVEISEPPLKINDSAFHRLYPLKKGAKSLYGTIATIGDPSGKTIIAVLFSADGRLEAVRVLDEVPKGQAFSREGWFSEFLGKGGDKPYPRSINEAKKPDAISGVTRSFLYTSEVLGRISDSIGTAADRKSGRSL